MSQKIKTTKEDFLKALEKCNTRDELVEYMGLSYSTINRRLKEYGISTFKRKFDENKFKELYEKGLTDSEIARQLNVSNSAITDYRNKKKLQSNFSYNRDILRKQILDASKSGKNLEQISILLNIDIRVVDYFLNFNEITDFSNYSLSNEEYQVLIGCLLGDGNISLSRNNKQAQFRFAHSEKQKEYCIWKTEKLKNIMYYEYVFNKKEQFDKRTQHIYTSYYSLSKEIPQVKSIFDRWYVYQNTNKRVKWIKRICKEDLMKLDALGLAVWFQDDGYHEDSGYLIATMCFSDNDIQIIKEYFKEKWDIELKIRKNNEIYISKDYRDKFKKIIEPYIHSDCKYKLLNK